jgi:alpha-L-fucosidase
MGTAWQYQPTNERYKSGTRLIELSIEARAKGGSLLLNVGPRPDGELPIEQEERLREMAAWYFINHECMDSVSAWVVSRENDCWFTSSASSQTLYAIITGTEDWKEGQRKTILLHSVKATPSTRISVLGQNSRIIEYKNDDVSCRYRQIGETLEISVVKAQRIYDDHRWPNPVVVKLENILPAFSDAIGVQTLDSKAMAGGVMLTGKVTGNKDGTAERACFYYRPYSGQVETLYAEKWKKTNWVKIDDQGGFRLLSPALSDKRQYEYRAVAEFHQVEINGEDKIFKPK